ncbi:hypothetical protein [Actinomadura sp. HBU206391]|uniref:hypothetical protein n=1 Tax=Actinomadura sp. HBU206391 TaxID=2731692 RepID=UPI00164F7975|nr:hypothetical protein [Actinomadura sp. HBU206391]MBC6457308.1 hypothetical protein [Actinomadura sp. HBU206391]
MTSATATYLRASDGYACAAGLLRFATPGELDALLGHLRHDRAGRAHVSHGMPNRMIAEAMLRRPDRGLLLETMRDSRLAGDALSDHTSSLLGRLLDLDDPEINLALYLSDRVPRNLRRQLAHQTSRRDGVSPVPLPARLWELLHEADGQGRTSRLLPPLLHSADPDLADHALGALRRGTDPHGAVRACRTLLDAGRRARLRELLELDALPEERWGPEDSEPGVRAYVKAALAGEDGAARLRELSERVRRPEWLRSAAEIADTIAREPWRQESPALVRTIVDRRHPSIPRVDWPAVLADEPRRRRADGPLPRPAARVMAQRTDTPPELLRLVIADHPALASLISDPTPELLAAACEHLALTGTQTVVNVAGNGLVAGTLTAEDVIELLPPEPLALFAESLWLPGMRGTATVRALTGRIGDVVLRPFLVDETGQGPRRRLRDPKVRAHWDPTTIYGRQVAAALQRHGDELTADQVLELVTPDAVLAPVGDAMPDPRVLRRLAELVHLHLGGRPEAWMVALRLLRDGFVGTLPELLMTSGVVGGENG